MPDNALVPSAGYFNAARVPQHAATWLFVVGHTSRKRMDGIIATVCNVQSSKRAFRPVFVLDDSEHIELMRQYGFSFEVICADEYMRVEREKQIGCFKKKWGAKLCVDLDSTKAAEALLSTGSSKLHIVATSNGDS
jgi:hypothetical protein